jgi:hypothetical protein
MKRNLSSRLKAFPELEHQLESELEFSPENSLSISLIGSSVVIFQRCRELFASGKSI